MSIITDPKDERLKKYDDPDGNFWCVHEELLVASLRAALAERDGLKEVVNSYADKLTASRSAVAFQKEEIDRLCFRTVDEAAVLAADARIRQLEEAVRWAVSNAKEYVLSENMAENYGEYDTDGFEHELLKRAGMEG